MVSQLRSEKVRQCKRVVTKIIKIQRVSKKRLDQVKKNKQRVLRRLLEKDPKSLSSNERASLASIIKDVFKSKHHSRSNKKKSSSSSEGSESSSREVEIVINSGERVATRAQVAEMMRKYEETKNEEIGEAPKIFEIRKNIISVNWKESETNIFYENLIRNNINNDPCLSGYYERKIDEVINKDDMIRVSSLAFAHFRRESNWGKSDAIEKVEFTDELIASMNKQSYIPPTNRLLMVPGRSELWKSETQVYSDIEKETKKNIVIPDTFSYRYTNRNVLDQKQNRELADFTREAEKESNIIKCNCCEGGLMKKCWENKDCPCYQANKKLKELQNRNTHAGTNLSTFNPILVPPSDHFFDTIGFSCSEACACNGRCTNNATFLLEKQICQLEIFRKDKDMGFGIRSNTAIPVGTPVLEFTGEICGEKLKSIDNDYSFAVISNDDNFHERTFGNPKNWSFTKWTKPFMERMTKQLKKVWFLNPKRIGNVARTCCHSCEPNLAMVRIFQKGFSPAHCRLILVTQEVIFPGDELTFDYGPGYVEETLKTKCLCQRAPCKSSKSFESLKKLSMQALNDYHIIRYHHRYCDFKKNVLDKISE